MPSQNKIEVIQKQKYYMSYEAAEKRTWDTATERSDVTTDGPE